MQIILTIQYAVYIWLIGAAHNAALPLTNLQSNNVLIRRVRQVVPTAFKPTCRPGERLSSHNECVPNFKVPTLTTKPMKPTPQFLVSLETTSAPKSLTSTTDSPPIINNPETPSASTFSAIPSFLVTTQFHSTHKEKLASTITNEVIVERGTTEGLKHSTSAITTKLPDYSPTTSESTRVPKKAFHTDDKYSPATLASTKLTTTTTTEIFYLHYHSGNFPKNHKCFYSKKNHSTEMLVSSAYEDYDY